MKAFWMLYAAVLLGVAYTLVWRLLVKTAVRRKQERAIAKAKEIGPLFRINEVNGVMAVCSEKDFHSAYEKFCKEVEDGKRELYARVVLKVAPTFTFWKRQSAQMLIHTGESKTAEKLIITLLENLLGITGKEMDSCGDSHKEKIARVLIIEDGRLFVPFSGGMLDAEEQKKFYGRKSIDDFREFLEGVIKKFKKG